MSDQDPMQQAAPPATDQQAANDQLATNEQQAQAGNPPAAPPADQKPDQAAPPDPAPQAPAEEPSIAPIPIKGPTALSPTEQKAIAAFHRDFLAGPPPGAETGAYAAAAHDRWAGRIHRALHGIYQEGEWLFHFAEGKFIQAVHATRKALLGHG